MLNAFPVWKAVADQETLLVHMPLGFVAHGPPTLALDADKGKPLRAWAEEMETVTAVLCVSAHWETEVPTVGMTERPSLLYDFFGFPEALSLVKYPCEGAPALAKRVIELIGARSEPTRPLDHGVWTPLLHMFPKHDVPVLQLSLAHPDDPRALFDTGRKLAPLLAEGVLILGSGNLVHNLRTVVWNDRGPAPGWALEFDAWCEEVLVRRDYDALIDFEKRSPNVRLAHPSTEHFRPVIFAAGAAGEKKARFPLAGFEFGSISRRTVEWT